MRRAALLLLSVLLAGCGSSPRDEVREQTALVIEAAGAGDAEAVRRGADALLAALQDADLPADETARLTALATSVRDRADLVDADLQARLRAEAEAEQARQELEAAERQLAEQQAREAAAAEEAAREAEKDRGKGSDKEDEDEEEDD